MPPDNRAPDQMRPVEITPGYLQTAEGSTLIVVGNTRVLCAATVEDSVPQLLRGSGKGCVTAEYSIRRGAPPDGPPGEVIRGRPPGRSLETAAVTVAHCAPWWT